jgi:hypothetical protein
VREAVVVAQDQLLNAVKAFIDTVIAGQRLMLAGLSYGGYLACGPEPRLSAHQRRAETQMPQM